MSTRQKSNSPTLFSRGSYSNKKGFLFALTLSLLFCFTVISSALTDQWLHSYYPYRVTISVDVPKSGEYVLELTPQMITDWVNEKALFKFKPDFFDYNNVRLVEIDEKDSIISDKVIAGYYIIVGDELIKNGGFEEHQNGKPTGWSVSHEAFKLSKTSHDGSWCMTVTGTDRNNCAQTIPTKKNTWYLFSAWKNGSASIGAFITRRWDSGWQSVDGSWSDPYIPSKKWYGKKYFFYTGDKSDWVSDALQVRMERYTGAVDDVSLRECSVAFVLKADTAGKKKYRLYYSPLEGMRPTPPGRVMKTFPLKKLKVNRSGKTDRLETGIIFSLPSNKFADVWYASPMRKILEHTPPPAAKRNKIVISAARNESEAVQIVFRPKTTGKILSVQAKLSGPIKALEREFPKNSFDIRRALYVPMITPSQPKSGRPWRSEFKGNLPDPLPKFAPVKFKAGDPNILIWVDIRVPMITMGGTYSGAIDIATSAGKISIPLELRVWDFTLPNQPACRTAFQMARYANNHLFPWHKVTSKEDKYILSRKYIEEMARYRISATAPQSAYSWYTGDKSTDKFKAYNSELPWALGKLGVTGFTIGHYSGNSLPNVKPEAIKKTVEEEYEPLAKYLASRNWLKWAYIQIDEPQAHAYPGNRAWIDVFRQYPNAKNIKMFAFVYDGGVWDEMRDHYDIFVPENNDMGDYVSLKGASKLPPGKEVWFYWTRTAHQWIDAPGIDQRLWAPKTWAFGGKGMSTWAIVKWWSEKGETYNHNPWINPYTHWGNGVLSYFYPPDPRGTDLPEKNMSTIPSLRMVLTRDGIEDYEYAVMLQRLIHYAKDRGIDYSRAERALKMFQRQFRTPSSWRLGEVYWEQTRETVAGAIVDLKKKLK